MTTTDHASAEPLTRRSGRRAALPVGVNTSVDSLPAPIVDPVISPRRAARAAREAAAAAALSAGSAVDAPAPTSPVVAPVLAATLDATLSIAEARVAKAPTASPAPVLESPVVSDPELVARNTGSFGGLAASIPGHVHGRRQTFVAATAAPRRRPAAQKGAVRPAAVERTRRSSVASTARRVGLLTVVCGIVATSILPALNSSESRAFAAGTGATQVASGSQQYDVSSTVTNSVGARDGYGATSVVDYEKTAISAREALGVTDYTGPQAADYLAKPLFDHLDRAEVFQVALQYLGTPYVHGGADPSAFDCSGLIMFVYAQFGIDLPHYVPTQDAMGTTIPQSEAVPGDLVVFDNEEHDGIYAGNGMILDAPKPGGFVTVRPIWDQAHHFVRIAG